MAIIDVVKWDGNDEEFIYKFPSEDLRLWTQLVVKTAQTAIFIKNGQILDEFGPGRHILSTNNIPLLNKIVNLPFGGDSPFQAEVWFVHQIKKLDNGWGTSVPIQLEDPKYNIIVPVRAFGQFGFTISNPKLILKELVGTAQVFTAEKIVRYFKAKVLSAVTVLISKKLILDKVSVLEIPAILDDLSVFCQGNIRDEFKKYGIEIVSFFFESINIPEDDPSVIQLKNAKATAMQVGTIGSELYTFNRSMDVLEKAAENKGTASELMGAGLGFGMGVGMSDMLSKKMSGNFNHQNQQGQTDSPPIITFWCVINNNQEGPFNLNQIDQMIKQGALNKNTLVWKKGLSNWVAAESQIELKSFFNDTPPPIPKI